jgi:hypothetical protein
LCPAAIARANALLVGALAVLPQRHGVSVIVIDGFSTLSAQSQMKKPE